MTSALLEFDRVSCAFGGIRAVNEVSLRLQPNEIVGLIGPNGAGKSTLVNLVTGVHRPTRGAITLDGNRIDGRKPHAIAAMGVARTFQIVQPFPAMTVLQNVMAGALFAGGESRIRDAELSARELLAFTGLLDQADKPAAQLTLAGRKRLELAKSLAMKPRLLLLDEVNAGLNSGELDRAVALIREVARRGITLVIIEHVLKVVLSLCTRIIVLHHGELIADATPAEVTRDQRVIEAYLGARFAERERRLHA
jgi:branched-chain amino acid transport system ATP-binding protein